MQQRRRRLLHEIRRTFQQMGSISRIIVLGILFILFSSLDPFPPSSMVERFADSRGTYPGAKCAIHGLDKIKQMAIVYTWVNGSIPCYQKLRMEHGGKKTVGGSRDREIGELKYSFRSLEKYLPWHEGPIYIVTPGHIPEWLDLNSSRVHLINQDELFPEYAKEFLPTFNTHVLEQFLYRIPGLTEYFLQVNDDYIFTNPLYPHDLFTCDGGIRILQERGTISHTPPTKKKGIWISSVLNTQQAMDTVWGKQDRKFLKHAPFVYSRRAFERVHQIFSRPLYETLKHKFRTKTDMNNPLLHYYYLIHQGSRELRVPIDLSTEDEMASFKLLLMKDNNRDKVDQEFQKVLQHQHVYKVLTLNDEYKDMRVARAAQAFLQAFLPQPSAFERDSTLKSNPVSIRNPKTCEIDPNILPPTPKLLERVQQDIVVVAYREVPLISFLNAIFRGTAFGFGLLLAYYLAGYVLKRDPCLNPHGKV